MGPVVIYDSGVGGLSVYQEIKRVCPNLPYLFISDNEAFPYGTKSEPELIDRVTRVVTRIDEVYRPSLLVVACNTASTVALPRLREAFDFEIVGVVPAIKPAALISKSRHIGLLATPATVARDYTQRLIDEFASDCAVLRVGSSELVILAERYLYGESIEVSDLEPILVPFSEDGELDTLVLACTHFPLLNMEIKDYFDSIPQPVTLVDSGPGIARRVAQLVGNQAGSEFSLAAVFTKRLDSDVFTQALKARGFSEFYTLTV